MYKRVLVTLDGSSFSEAVLPEAARLLAETQAQVHLLIVAEEPAATSSYAETEPLTMAVPAPGGVVRIEPAPLVETRAQATRRVTDELREFLIAEGIPLEKAGVAVHTAVRFGDPAEEIIRFAEELKIDLIVMATHGHTGLARRVFGGVASHVVAGGVCPVLLVRPAGLKEH
ncbi:MAG TPA: universal stress protein [Dehalococcoidia bacterium]|nr:universal stress protein [Dehalococcoidia bacterium]